MDGLVCHDCGWVHGGEGCIGGRGHLLVQRDDPSLQGVPELGSRPDNMGRGTLPEGEPEEDEESSGRVTTKVDIQFGSYRHSFFKPSDRTVQSLGHGPTGKVELGFIREQVLRWIRLLGWPIEGSSKPIRITIEVGFRDDPETQT